MNHESITVIDDPLGCRDDLRDALDDPNLGTSSFAGEQAAFRLSVALGRCRLFGIALGHGLGVPLSPHCASAATTELIRVLAVWSAEADHLGERWDSARDPAEADDICAGLLSAHLDARAACLAIAESAETGVADPLRERAEAQIERLEEALRSQSEVLSTLAGSNLLANWRELLVPEFRERYFWWLTDLEVVARRVEEEAVRTFPGEATWRALRQAASRLVSGEPLLPPLVDAHGFADATEEESAVAPGPETVSPGSTLCWISPDGQARAELNLPDEMTPETEVLLNFTSRVDDGPLVGLEERVRVVRLAGAAARIDDEGKAWFHLADLSGAPLRLTVGDPEKVWRFQPEGD